MATIIKQRVVYDIVLLTFQTKPNLGKEKNTKQDWGATQIMSHAESIIIALAGMNKVQNLCSNLQKTRKQNMLNRDRDGTWAWAWVKLVYRPQKNDPETLDMIRWFQKRCVEVKGCTYGKAKASTCFAKTWGLPMNCVAQSRLLSVAWMWIAVADFDWGVPKITPWRLVGGYTSTHTHVCIYIYTFTHFFYNMYAWYDHNSVYAETSTNQPV